jgi:hypothetical protein
MGGSMIVFDKLETAPASDLASEVAIQDRFGTLEEAIFQVLRFRNDDTQAMEGRLENRLFPMKYDIFINDLAQ